MAINWTEAQIDEIVASVMKSLTGEAPATKEEYDGAGYNGKKYIGVYTDMKEAIDAAESGYKAIRAMSTEEREKVIGIIRDLCRREAPTMARLGVSETKMGRVDHKTAKHVLVADKTPGTVDIVAQVKTGDYGLTLTEMAPFGVVGSITPSTNPSETVICNSIGMIAAGNGVVFNPHPNAIATSNYAVDLINRASEMAGGPRVLVSSVVKPTLDTADIMYKDPRIKLLVCTGGPGVVKSVLSSGKKAIGAGAGNPPVIVDDTADIRKAGKDIIDGCTFDNNLPCIAEKEVFAFNNIADELIDAMKENGAYLINSEQANKLASIVLVDKKNPKTGIVSKIVNRDCVGRDAKVLLEKIGITVCDKIRCIIVETDFNHDFVQHELMMPILPIVRVKNIDEAIDLAVKAEHGNRHTAHMHSKNIDNLTRFARAVETTIFVKNAPSYAGIGFGGEGHTTFTIAGPTGEGLTSAKSFTRQRRCVLSESFRII
ncbi:MAG: aldehyde dehydrogenase EutE [Ruminococcaceae bacterium]|nr:aldehyde dehydrogenase EutE [Oscillospiraceae bacterium]